MCHPSAPGRDAGDHPAIPPVPGLLHPLSQPAFLLGIKQAGYLAGLCNAEGLNSESITLQGGRMPIPRLSWEQALFCGVKALPSSSSLGSGQVH